jgi:hypothetical protein
MQDSDFDDIFRMIGYFVIFSLLFGTCGGCMF